MKNDTITLLGMAAGLILVSATPVYASARNWTQTSFGANAVTVQSADESWNGWMENYYRSPAPEQLVPAVFALSEAGFFESEGQPAIAIGFLGTVFAQNPEQISGWMRAFRHLPASHQRLVAAGLWYSGAPQGAQELRVLARDMPVELRSELESLLAYGPTNIAGTPVLSESSLNLQWGAFLASGQQLYITNVLAALGAGEGGLSYAVRDSLAEKAADHERVYQICQAQLARQPEAVRRELRTVLGMTK